MPRRVQKMSSLVKRFVRMFGCDAARIVRPNGILFLILGHKRNTKTDRPVWFRNGKRINFEYLSEEVVASGKTEAELIASAEHYKKLCTMSTERFSASLLKRHCKGGRKGSRKCRI